MMIFDNDDSDEKEHGRREKKEAERKKKEKGKTKEEAERREREGREEREGEGRERKRKRAKRERERNAERGRDRDKHNAHVLAHITLMITSQSVSCALVRTCTSKALARCAQTGSAKSNSSGRTPHQRTTRASGPRASNAVWHGSRARPPAAARHGTSLTVPSGFQPSIFGHEAPRLEPQCTLVARFWLS